MVLRITLLRMERECTQREIAQASTISPGRYSMIDRAPSTMFSTARRCLAVNEVARLVDDRGAAWRRS